ncbi:hypothetical protein [Cupriavidus taiwanensis]|uniref:hypothetical protein n=1 Tax=Cupriavidus taiwanensis TaxID=164546 RepID=UPI000E16965C|nr:hypothetical protein CBM2585_B50156 [Cupriavidus taiwanensis]
MKRSYDDADLMAALQQPDAYPHLAPAVQVVETHISHVFLAGDYAYKVRKAVRFDYGDFSTAHRRLPQRSSALPSAQARMSRRRLEAIPRLEMR